MPVKWPCCAGWRDRRCLRRISSAQTLMQAISPPTNQSRQLPIPAGVQISLLSRLVRACPRTGNQKQVAIGSWLLAFGYCPFKLAYEFIPTEGREPYPLQYSFRAYTLKDLL